MNISTNKLPAPIATGYAEPKPKDKSEAQIPGAKPEPDDEEGGLEHDPDPEQ